jgi:hypothetical protein
MVLVAKRERAMKHTTVAEQFSKVFQEPEYDGSYHTPLA